MKCHLRTPSPVRRCSLHPSLQPPRVLSSHPSKSLVQNREGGQRWQEWEREYRYTSAFHPTPPVREAASKAEDRQEPVSCWLRFLANAANPSPMPEDPFPEVPSPAKPVVAR